MELSERLQRLHHTARRADENTGPFVITSLWDDGERLSVTCVSPKVAMDVFFDWMGRGAVGVMIGRKQ